MLYVTYLEHPDADEYRYNKYDSYGHKYIIHNGLWHWGRFPSLDKLQIFLSLAGLKMDLVEEHTYHVRKCGKFMKWNIDCKLDDQNYFWSLDDLPANVTKFIGLSNGSMVECYLYNDGDTLHIYRPNPNAKEVYKPLSFDESSNYKYENGYI